MLQTHQSRKQGDGGRPDLKSYAFARCSEALAAFSDHLPEIIDLVQAMAIAELEIEGRYVEATHDPFFADFDESSVGARDLALFPDYLVCIGSESLHDSENAGLMEILASELPIKVVVQVSDVLEEPALRAHLGLIAPAAQLGKMAMGLGNAYVLQSSISHLYQSRHGILAGLAYAGPALFSVFSGSPPGAAELPPYLLAAAAMQSRAFPAFTYDPAAGPDWAARFALDGNPQPEADWPVHEFGYEDEAHQSVREQVAFTFVDFAACDPRHARHFAVVPRAEWNGSMVPVGNSLASDSPAVAGKVPYLQMVNGDHVLQRALVDEKLLAAAHRCREMWHSLQELGGVRSSQAERLLARERKVWEEQKQREIEALRRDAKPASPAAPAAPAAAPAAPAAKPVAAEAEPEKPSDDAVHRDAALHDLQRVHQSQQPHVRLRCEQAGHHCGHQRRDLPRAGGGGGELPGLDHPPGQTAQSERARDRRAAEARRAVPLGLCARSRAAIPDLRQGAGGPESVYHWRQSSPRTRVLRGHVSRLVGIVAPGCGVQRRRSDAIRPSRSG